MIEGLEQEPVHEVVNGWAVNGWVVNSWLSAQIRNVFLERSLAHAAGVPGGVSYDALGLGERRRNAHRVKTRAMRQQYLL